MIMDCLWTGAASMTLFLLSLIYNMAELDMTFCQFHNMESTPSHMQTIINRTVCEG